MRNISTRIMRNIVMACDLEVVVQVSVPRAEAYVRFEIEAFVFPKADSRYSCQLLSPTGVSCTGVDTGGLR